MSTIERSEGARTSWDELPAAVRTYLTAHQAGDLQTAISAYAVDAAVTDEGRTHHGREEIRAWLECAAVGFTHTNEFVSAARTGEGRFDVMQHLEGNFAGGVVDLHYRFTLYGPLIGRLVIEP
jgi:ketosteroid isomerase-like protein